MILSSFRWVVMGFLILEGIGSFGHTVEADAFKVSQTPPRPREYRLDSYNLSSSHDVRALCGVAQMGANQYGIAPNVTPEVLNGYDRALKQACVANRDEAKAQCSAPFDGVKGELACLPGTVTCFNPKNRKEFKPDNLMLGSEQGKSGLKEGNPAQCLVERGSEGGGLEFKPTLGATLEAGVGGQGGNGGGGSSSPPPPGGKAPPAGGVPGGGQPSLPGNTPPGESKGKTGSTGPTLKSVNRGASGLFQIGIGMAQGEKHPVLRLIENQDKIFCVCDLDSHHGTDGKGALSPIEVKKPVLLTPQGSGAGSGTAD